MVRTHNIFRKKFYPPCRLVAQFIVDRSIIASMSSAADHQQLRRRRQRAGCRVVAVEISAEGEDALVLSGLLAERDLDDREAIAAAIARFVALLVDDRHA